MTAIASIAGTLAGTTIVGGWGGVFCVKFYEYGVTGMVVEEFTGVDISCFCCCCCCCVYLLIVLDVFVVFVEKEKLLDTTPMKFVHSINQSSFIQSINQSMS